MRKSDVRKMKLRKINHFKKTYPDAVNLFVARELL